MAEAALAALVLLTTGAALAAAVVQRRLAAGSQLVERSRLRIAELERLHDARRVAALATVATGAVEGGTRATQLVHFGIASIPFGILEAIPPTRAVTRAVRVTHDLIAGSIYGVISTVSRGVRAAANRGVIPSVARNPLRDPSLRSG
jgi:hypothetical protein